MAKIVTTIIPLRGTKPTSEDGLWRNVPELEGEFWENVYARKSEDL